MSNKRWFALSLATVLSLAGCAKTSSDDSVSTVAGGYGSRGLALTTNILGNTDVAGMGYEISACGGGIVHAAQLDLEDLLLPGMIPGFENKPFDGDSQHTFADHFVVLPAGCYDVKITPLRANGNESQDCASATATQVVVVDQLTTEILLVSQCQGPERGALDVVGSLNHPPGIESLMYDPSKFIACSEDNGRPTVVLCAKAGDPDADPLEFVWEQVGGGQVYSGPTVIEHVREGGWETQCVKVELSSNSAGYEFELTVYDMLHGSDNTLIRAETWFNLNEYGNVVSHAKLRFPVYVGGDGVCEEPASNGDGGGECYDRNGSFSQCYEDRCYDASNWEVECECIAYNLDTEVCEDFCYDEDGIEKRECSADLCYDRYRREMDCACDDFTRDQGSCVEFCFNKNGSPMRCYYGLCYNESRHQVDCEAERPCPKTASYWKEHNKYAMDPINQIPWLISEDTAFFGCQQTWGTVMNVMAEGNPSSGYYLLAHQYIAARLNLANNGPWDYWFEVDLMWAERILSDCYYDVGDETAQGDSARTVVRIIEQYNDGELLACVPCSEGNDACE